jgi:hypothetical protein
VADAAAATGQSVDATRNLAAVRLDGWDLRVAMISVNGAEAASEVLRQLAVAVDPIVRLRLAVSVRAGAGQAGLVRFFDAVDWAIARRSTDDSSATFEVAVIQSLDDAIGSAGLAADLRAETAALVALIDSTTVGVIVAAVGVDGPSEPATDLVAGLTRTRSVLAGISAIGPDLAAAAFDRATGALELARRLGPGNAVVA